MIYNQMCYNIFSRISTLLRQRNQFYRNIRVGFTTLNENVSNYYDIIDKRNLTESSAFDTNDFRKGWTNRDESITEDHLDISDHIHNTQKSVPIYRTCKITNYRSRTRVPITSMEGEDLVSGICYNMLGIENDMDLESLYNYFQKFNFSKSNRFIELSNDKLQLMTEFQIQIEKLLHHRMLKMEDTVRILLLFDKLGLLSPDLMNLFQSNMLLNIHKFTPFQVITTFEVFRKHKKKYENFLNVLCLIFYDHMIPSLKSNPTGESNIEIRYVLQFLKVLKDFKFKRLTDVLYAQVYDKLDMLNKEDMIQVSNTFFRNKKDTNFVELYTKILSNVFKIPLIDLYKFEEYVLNNLNNMDTVNNNINNNTYSNNSNITTSYSKDVSLDDLNILKSIFNCNSEFLLSSVHHRIEFKRLWRYNIKTNNVSWKVDNNNNTNSIDSTNNTSISSNNTSISFSDSISNYNGDNSNYITSVTNSKQMYSYVVNFPELYEKIENIILKGFKFQNYSINFICNIISTVLDYSRYSNSSSTKNILTNLYALLLTQMTSETPGQDYYGNYIQNLRLISPKTLMDNSHVYFYKIDPKCEFCKIKEVNYYKPHLTIYSFFNGDYSLYTLLLETVSSFIENMDRKFKESNLNSSSKEDQLSICNIVRNILHPIYCPIRSSTKCFLSIDILHMNGKFSNKSISQDDLYRLIENSNNQIQVQIQMNREEKENRLLKSLNSFSERVYEYISSFLMSDTFTLKESLEILRTLITLKICNPEFNNEEIKNKIDEYIDSKVGTFLEYFGTENKEDLQDGVNVGDDIKLFDCINDLMICENKHNENTRIEEYNGNNDNNQEHNKNRYQLYQYPYYQLFRETLKVIYSRTKYYSVPELIMLSSCISCSLRYFEKIDLESEEILENLDQTIRLIREEVIENFQLKSRLEEEFNIESERVYDLLMKYH